MKALPDITHWPRISDLLDQALDLAPGERSGWVEALADETAEVRATLHRLLAARARVDTGSFLNVVPALHVAAPPLRHELQPGRAIGPYRLIRVLGEGGMGSVWLAERADGQLRREVALKLPHMGWQDNLAQRLARERDILASLEHPHIARLYDAGVDELGRPWMALEYVQGIAINQFADEHRLDVQALLALLLQVCSAVAYAHSRLVIHRDLKPSNILVTGDGQVRLLDFGIAKLVQGEQSQATALTQAAGRAFTPDYASPEQVRGDALSTASDIYSLGVVAYELLSGQRPYRLKRGSAAELEEAIVGADLLKASDAATSPAAKQRLRGDLDAILGKALKSDPSQRYGSIDAFGQDLLRFLNRRPVLAQPDRLGYRVRRFVQRNRLAVSLGTVVSVALVTGTGAVLWQAQLARQQAARAEGVKRFILSVFEEADSTAGSHRKTTAADLLQRALTRMDGPAAPDDPLTRVEVLNAIGYSLIGQGELASANDVLSQSLALARRLLGEHHVATADARLKLAETLVLLKRGNDAAPLIDDAEHDMRQADHAPGTVAALRWRSRLLLDRGQFDESLVHARRAVDLAESGLTATDRQLLHYAYSDLATLLGVVRQPGSAEFAFKALQVAREMHGARVTETVLSTRSLYAYALINENRTVEGLSELKALVVQQVALLGEDHISVGLSHQRISQASLALGDPVTAVESSQAALRIARAAAGPRFNDDVALQHLNLGQALFAARRFAPAERELRTAIEAFDASTQANPAYARLARADLALLLARTGRLDDANAMFERLLLQPPGHAVERAALELRLGVVRSLQGRHSQALDLLRASAQYASTSAPIGFQANAWAALGASQLDAGQVMPAVESLARADELFAKVHVNGSPAHASVWTALANARLAAGKPDESAAAADRAIHFWQSFDPTGRDLALALLARSAALSASGQDRPARESMDQARVLLTSAGLPQDRDLLARAQRALARKDSSR